jgi:hypothetical protein
VAKSTCEVLVELGVVGCGVDGKVRQRDDVPSSLLEEKVP